MCFFIKNKGFLLVFGVLLLTFIAYSDSFYGEFQFDDIETISYNSSLRDFTQFTPETFVDGIIHFARPVTTFTFALNYQTGGSDVRLYHITNFLIHILNGLLVFYFVFLTLNLPKLSVLYKDRALSVAMISSAIFLLHPIQTQAVSYICQRYESLASLFYLSSLIAYIKARGQKSNPPSPPFSKGGHGGITNSELQTSRLKSILWYLAFVVSYILAIGSKEIAITLPVIILLYDFYFLEDRPFLKRVAGPGILIVLSFIAGIIILIRISKGIDVGFSVKAFTPWEYLLTQFRALTVYIRLLFLPINQNADYDFRISKSLLEMDTFLSLLFILILIVAAIISFRRWRLGSFFILWFFIILAPTSSIIPIIDPIFEHRVYLASLGIFIVVVDAFFVSGIYRFIEERFSVGRWIMIGIALSMLLTFSVMTFQRNKVWQTGLNLWEDVVKKSPGKARGYNNLGEYYAFLGKHNEAVAEYRKAIALDKYYVGTYYNIALSLEKIGLFSEARYFYRCFYKSAPPECAERKRYSFRKMSELEGYKDKSQ